MKLIKLMQSASRMESSGLSDCSVFFSIIPCASSRYSARTCWQMHLDMYRDKVPVSGTSVGSLSYGHVLHWKTRMLCPMGDLRV